MNEKNKKQIVTVAVITYHSAATILETLDSILAQTYGPENIELIITDDGSKDNTLQVIKQWLEYNQDSFHCVKLFANEVNGGISKNCNVAWKAATSEWIKTIAGDDILLPTCLTDNIAFVENNKNDDIAVLFSKMQSFKVTESGVKQDLAILPTVRAQHFFKLPVLKQFQYLQQQGISGAPSAFINRSKLASIGYADEQFPMMEDHPLWFKLCQAGYHLKFMNKLTVYYRIGNGVSNSKNKLINSSYINEIISIEKKLVIPTLDNSQWLLKVRKRLWPKAVLFVSHIYSNKRSVMSMFFLNVVLIIKPYYFFSKLRSFFKF